MNDEDIKKIGDEMTRLLEPVYESLDSLQSDVKDIKEDIVGVKKVLKEHTGLLDEHTDKIDALMAEVHDIHQEIGADRDKTNSEIEKIKKHVGLPV